VGPQRTRLEKRVSTRVPIRVLVEYEAVEDFLADYTSNVSLGGMFIQTREPLDIGTRFRLRFRLPDRAKPVETYGTVRWVIPQGSGPGVVPGMGIQFDALTAGDLRAVQAYLAVWEG